jgi:hypothetical protein
MGKESQLFLTTEFQLINVAEKRETENHQENTTVITIVSKSHRWMLKLEGESTRRNKFA